MRERERETDRETEREMTTDLVHHHGVSLALGLLAHPPGGDPAKVVAECLSLAVLGELVEDEEHHGVAA